MKPGLVEGVLLALVASVLGALLCQMFAITLGAGLGLRTVAALLSLIYGLYLYARAARCTGRSLFLFLWLMASILLAGTGAPLYVVFVVYLSGVWLLRSALFHSRAIAVLADLALVVLGALAAAWAWHQTGSVLAALWSLLVTQSLFVLVPGRARASLDDGTQSFARAERAATAALRRLGV